MAATLAPPRTIRSCGGPGSDRARHVQRTRDTGRPDVRSSGATGYQPTERRVPYRLQPTFLLDMATSVVAAGRLSLAIRDQLSIPEGRLLDREGRPSTNPHDFADGEPFFHSEVVPSSAATRATL